MFGIIIDVRRSAPRVFPFSFVRIIDVRRPSVFVMALTTVAFVVTPFVIVMRRRGSRLAPMGYLDLRRSRGRSRSRRRSWGRPRCRRRDRRRAWRRCWPWSRRGPGSWRTTRTRRCWPTRGRCRVRFFRRSRPRMRMMMPRRLPQIRRAEPTHTEPCRPDNSTGIKDRRIRSTWRVCGHSHRNC